MMCSMVYKSRYMLYGWSSVMVHAEMYQVPLDLHKTGLRVIYAAKSMEIGFGNYPLEICPVGFNDSNWVGSRMDRKWTTRFLCIYRGSYFWEIEEAIDCYDLHIRSRIPCIKCFSLKVGLPWRDVYIWKGCVDVLRLAIKVDNPGSIKMAENDASWNRNKQIDIRYHWRRDSLEEGKVAIEYCPTTNMIALTYIL